MSGRPAYRRSPLLHRARGSKRRIQRLRARDHTARALVVFLILLVVTAVVLVILVGNTPSQQ